MDNEILLALIAALLGGGGGVTAIATAIINRRKSRAEVEKTKAEIEKIRAEAQTDSEKNRADAASIITSATKEILGEYRLRNDELEAELATVKHSLNVLRKEFRDTQVEMEERDQRYAQEQALQDQIIENTNSMVMKLQLVNEILAHQIRSIGLEPLVNPAKISTMTIQELKNIVRSIKLEPAEIEEVSND